jgi:hypothetical protein
MIGTLTDIDVILFCLSCEFLLSGFMEEGNLSIPDLGLDFAYNYNVLENNLNLLSISKLSSESRKSMHECEDCGYYPMYEKYVGFFDRFDYADHIITSAFHGDRTAMGAGSMDFGVYSADGRTGMFAIVNLLDGCQKEISLKSFYFLLFGSRSNCENNHIHERLDACDSRNGRGSRSVPEKG